MGVAGSLFWDLLKMLGYFPNGKSTNLETYIYIYLHIYIIIITTIIIVTIIYIYILLAYIYIVVVCFLGGS
jgi:hypothetical protein